MDESCTKQVSSLKEAMHFWDSFLDEIVTSNDSFEAAVDPQRVSLDYLERWISNATHSSCFSGIAAPETALLGLHQAIQQRAGHEARSGVWVVAIKPPAN